MFLICTYAATLHLGVGNGLGREIPFNTAKGDVELVRRIKQVGLGAALWTICIFAVFVIGYQHFSQERYVSTTTLLLLILYFASQQIYQFFQSILQCELKFNKASLQQGIAGIFVALLTVLLLVKWGLNGLLTGYATALLTGALFFGEKKGLLTFHNHIFDKDLICRLFKIGFPIMTVGFLCTIIISADRWIVITFLGMKDMGYYSFGYTVFSCGMLFLNLLTTQFYPRLSIEYGKNECILETAVLLKKQVRIAGAMGGIMSLGMLMLLPFIISWLLPAYKQSLHVAQILLVGLPFISIALTIVFYFNAIGKQQYLLLPMALTVLLNLTISVVLIKSGFKKEGVAVSTVLSYIVFCLLLYKSSLSGVKKDLTKKKEAALCQIDFLK
jgi:O-antigen/teichoic acid export membrane protein